MSPNTGTTPAPAIKKPAKTKITKVAKKGKNKCLIKLKKVAKASGYQVIKPQFDASGNRVAVRVKDHISLTVLRQVGWRKT